MQPQDLFTVALGLQTPWQVSDVRFDPEAGEIHFEVACGESRLACPACGALEQSIHDRKARTWQHLHLFQYRAYVHARVPRVRCSGCGKTRQVPVPWARSGSGFTLLFEALAITLAQHLPVRQVATLLGVSDARLWRPLKALVEAARAQEDFSPVEQIGVDEKHVGRLGFLTLFHDARERRVLFTTERRKASVFDAFVDDLRTHGGDPAAITAVSMDLSSAYRAGAQTHLPQAKQCFDPFHIVKLAHAALEQVRREEVRYESDLRGIRWATLKDPKQWSFQQFLDMQWLSRSGLKTARAWRLKERLREIIVLARSGQPAQELFTKWISWARRCRLEPFKRLGASLREHLDGIVNTFEQSLSNATAESINAQFRQPSCGHADSARSPTCRPSSILSPGNLRTCRHLPTATQLAP